eukprot:gene15207-21283_t
MSRSQTVASVLNVLRRFQNSSPGVDVASITGQVSTSAPSSGFSALLSQLRGLSATAATAASSPKRLPKNTLLTDLKQLSKFKLSSLVMLTASAGFVAGSGESIDWKGLAMTSLGTLGAAACANTLNQLYEISNDSKMTRTANRPLPSGRMSPLLAAAFALSTGAMGLGILYTQVPMLVQTGGRGGRN